LILECPRKRTLLLLVPRNSSRGRGVISSLAELREQSYQLMSAWVLPVWNVASWSVVRCIVLLVPRNSSRGRRVIPSLAELREQSYQFTSAWVLPVWNVASWSVVRCIVLLVPRNSSRGSGVIPLSRSWGSSLISLRQRGYYQFGM
jgi:hypothetical protein